MYEAVIAIDLFVYVVYPAAPPETVMVAPPKLPRYAPFRWGQDRGGASILRGVLSGSYVPHRPCSVHKKATCIGPGL